MLTKKKKMISPKDKVYLPLITAVSILIPLTVAILMVLPPQIRGDNAGGYSGFPLFHATLNGATAILLLFGFYFIRNKKIQTHKICMISGFILSSVFLVSYVIYHYNVESTPYRGDGFIRMIYFFILITHISFATVIVPLALIALYRAFTNQIEKHRKIVRWTFPIWLYVAVTGVLVYLLMKPYYG